MNIAIITARGGSKRIPRKNIKDFLGKPIIAYSIEAALASKLFDEVMVSTDDEEIAQIARSLGASVPFLRSGKSSDDFATTAEVLQEVLASYKALGKEYTSACCIYPTAPFVNTDSLTKAFTLLTEKKLDSVFPIQRFSFPIQRALVFKENKLAWLQPENASKRSQDLETTYHDTGQFYFFNVSAFLASGSLLTTNSSGIELNEMEAHDIDTEADWNVAEFKYVQLKRTQ
jgi:pseudaminic acid cytidylyltransferase